ncbi:MAG: Asp-tRNA(Asn)/Glu-tRNA(Gln) amidotransferase subunit GatC [Candidatus Omnitrophica bacterium]|nr:Asp-tRNA(Asn)/Glu-tRNA(Gln) amidotransferase subunit GatC [Candidatus Omnitrophota bacterium]
MKQRIDKKTVRHVARLSRISLSGKEVALYQKQLADILDYINQLNKADTTGTPPTSHPLESLKNVFREDRVRKSLPAEKALQNAPERKDDFFSVPKIIE